MTIEIKKRSILALAVLAVMGAQAQTPASTLPAQMVQAARKAVATNPEVRQRWNGFKAADQEREVARGGYFPLVDLKSVYGRESSSTPVLDSGEYNISNTQLSVQQMLFDGMFTANEARRLGYAKLTRYYELMDTSEAAALEAIRAYADVVRYRELVDAGTQNYVEHKRTAQLVEERAKAGVGRGVDVEQALGRLALAESNLLIELTNLHDVSARYLRIVGEKPPASLPTMPDKFKIGVMPTSIEALFRDGLQGSPTLNAAVENVRAYRLAIESSKAPKIPRLDLRAYQILSTNSNSVAGDARSQGVQLLLTYNLYRGGADKARSKQAVDLAEQARDLQEKACRDVRQTLAIAYSDVSSLDGQRRYQDLHRLSTEKSLEAYRQQFDIGQRTLLDMLDSQNEYFEANRAYLNSHYNQIIAQARTLAGMGRLVSTLGVDNAEVPNVQDAGQDRDQIDPAELCPLDDVTVDTIDQIKADNVIPPQTRPAAAAAAPAPTAKPPAKVRLAGDTLFDYKKSELKPEGRVALDNLLTSIKDVKIAKIIAVGHTDGIANDKYNNTLSLARVESVKAYLVSKGVDAKLIETSGKGKTQPVADNATDEGRAKNRRVDIVVVPQGAPAK
jgi:adhesin transport system outer membrane protein